MSPIVPDDSDFDVLQNSLDPTLSVPAQQRTSWLERFLLQLFVLLLALAVLGFLVWLDIRMHSEAVSRQPIGRFLSMSGPGGIPSRVVIETDTGSYPLKGVPAVAKGTPLVLEVRASGYRYICDVSRSLCIGTVRDEFKSAEPITNPSSSTNPSAPSVQPKGAVP